MSAIPSASRRRTFKPFAQAPRDGTPFIVPHIARYNPFAKTFEMLMRDQFSGELEWVAQPRVWRAIRFCDLLPLPYALPETFAMTLVATPNRRKSWRERVVDRLFGWMCVPDTVSLAQYCWQASAIEARRAETHSGSVHESAPGRPNPVETPNPIRRTPKGGEA